MLKSKKNESVNKVLKTLLVIKETLHETAEPSVIQQLDAAISQIQQMENGSNNASCSDILNCLNSFFKALPSINDIINFFSDLNE